MMLFIILSETNFLKMGKKLGNKIENGKSMFIYQALLLLICGMGLTPSLNNETLKLLD
jgi:shikimate 5-dehydrogenase